MSDISWFVVIDGKQQGPFTSTAILNLHKNGRIDADALVWHEELKDWQPLNTVGVFSGLLPDNQDKAVERSIDFDEFQEPGDQGRSLLVRLAVCTISIVSLIFLIVVCFPINTTNRFFNVFVFNPAGIMLACGICIAPTLAIFDAMYLGMVPMLQNMLKKDKKEAREESEGFRLLLNAMSHNAILAGCIGVIISLLGLTTTTNIHYPELAFLYSMVVLVYGLLISLFNLMILKVHNRLVRDKRETSSFFRAGEFAVLIPTLLIILAVACNYFLV